MKQRGMELWIGVFVLAGLVVLGGLVIEFGGLLRLSRPAYKVRVEFDKVTGLRVGTPVRMLGIDIGEVTSLKFRPHGEGVVMTLKIDGKVDVPSDATLMVLTEGLLGDNYLEFSSGKGAPLSKDGEALVEGQAYRSPQEYLKDAMDGLRKTSTMFEGLTANLNKRLADDEFFDNLKKTVAAAPDTVKSFKETSDSFKETSERIKALAEKLSTDTSELAKKLESVSDGVNSQVEHQGKNMDKLTASLLESTTELNKTLSSLREITDTVKKGEGTVGGLLMKDDVYKETVATLQKTQKMLEELEETVRFVRQHPEAFVWGK